MPKWGIRVSVSKHLEESTGPQPARGKWIVPQRQSATNAAASQGMPVHPAASKMMLPRRERQTPVAPSCHASELSAISQSPARMKEWMEFIGSVSESREDHLCRHNGGLRSCPRCKWYRFANSWVTSYGGTEVTKAGPRGRVCWLQERPVKWGGMWGLGCMICAAQAGRVATGAPVVSAATRRRNLGSKWCRFEVCPRSLQAEHVKQHAHYDVHKLAERAYFNPGVPVTLTLQSCEEDDILLSGAVPQPLDWLRAWQAARCAQSWAVAATHAAVEQFAHQIHRRPQQSRGLKHMAEIIREVVRRRKRQWIRDCTSIALSFDDRQGYKLMRFRCDAPFPLITANVASEVPCAATPTAPVWQEGIVGCTDCLMGCTLTDLADDYAMRTVDQVVKQIRAFCGHDEELYTKFSHSVRIVVVDGALQKVAQFMGKTHFPNIVLITRDPAHMVRIATRDPLLRTGRFEEQHKRLFTNRHALFKELQHSEIWQARLQDCQRIVLGRRSATSGDDGSTFAATQGGGVQHVLRHFSYAPQRFESWADPMRKYACTLNAVALLLADVAGDDRQPKVKRDLAQTCLDAMTPRDLWEVGIVGDFGEIAMRCCCACASVC